MPAAVLCGVARAASLQSGRGGARVWLITGLVLFSQMTRLHPRYVEGFTPAVAALVGIGVAWATQPRGRIRLAIFALALGGMLAYAAYLLYGTPALWWAMLTCALARVLRTWFDRVDTGVAAVALALVACWRFPPPPACAPSATSPTPATSARCPAENCGC